MKMTHKQMLTELDRLGYFWHVTGDHIAPSVLWTIGKTSKTFKDALRAYQDFMGLTPDADVGPKTNESIMFRKDAFGHPRICGCPDFEMLTEEEINIAKGTQTWPSPEDPIVFVRNFSAVPGLSKQQTTDAFQAMCDNINSNLGVRLQWGTQWTDADVQVIRDNLSGGTLALAALSVGQRRPQGWRHYQKYDDSNQTWNPFMLQAVSIHETLHTLGFSHSADRNAILYPTYSGQFDVMQPSDIKRMRKYYPPFDDDDDDDIPGDKPSGKDKISCMFVVNDEVFRFDGRGVWRKE